MKPASVHSRRVQGAPQVTPDEREHPGSRRDPEERALTAGADDRERSLDKTLADSFPTSDPPSSIPDPTGGDRSGASPQASSNRHPLAGLPPGTWAALSISSDEPRLVGTGATKEEAFSSATRSGHGQVRLLQVPAP